jgi:hypothetical protein
MTITAAIQAFFADTAGQVAAAVLLVAIVDLVLGIAAAIRDRVFQWENVAAWLRSTLAGRVLPTWVLLFVGYFAHLNVAGIDLLGAAGIAAGLLYVAETVGTIVRLWGPNRGDQKVPVA